MYGLTTGYGAGAAMTGYRGLGGFGGGYGGRSCICSFPALIMLILIVLQFTRRCCNTGEDGDGGYEGGFGQQVGNGVLFIIAFFFLACAGCGVGGGYGGY